MLKLFSNESTDELRDALIASVWVISVLVFGTLVVWLMGVLINTSLQSPLGFGGAVVVIIAAAATGAFVYKRNKRGEHRVDTDVSRRIRPTVSLSPNATGPKQDVRPLRPSPPAPKPELARPTESLNPHNSDELFLLKRQLSDALTASDYDKSELIIRKIEDAEGQREWCHVQREAIRLRRRRTI